MLREYIPLGKNLLLLLAIFVGMLLKSYKVENTLSGGSSCKWYINEEIPEIENFFDRMLDAHVKVEWISAGDQQFRALEQKRNLEEKTVMQLKDMDPWEFEGSGYRCTVTISRLNNKQSWWFSSCTKCHRASTPYGSQYKCSGGCPSTTAEPKYRLCLVGTDGTGTAEFTLFGRVARQIVGKPMVSLIRSISKNQYGPSAYELEHILPELAALVSQNFTFSNSILQPYDPSFDDETRSSAMVASSESQHNTGEDSNAPKKVRFDRKTIPCRKTLTFEDNRSAEEAPPVPDQTTIDGTTVIDDTKSN